MIQKQDILHLELSAVQQAQASVAANHIKVKAIIIIIV